MNVNLSKLVSYSDANGDAVSKYQIQADTVLKLWMNGDATIDVGPIDMSGGNYEFTPGDMNHILIMGNKAGEGDQETFKIRAHDGKDWGSWAVFYNFWIN